MAHEPSQAESLLTGGALGAAGSRLPPCALFRLDRRFGDGMESEIDKLFAEADPAEDLETIPRMECQAFEHHDYLVFMFHDLRDWMLALQLIGVKEVDYSITRKTKKIGIGRVLHGKRLIELAQKAASAAPAPTAG